MGIDLKYCVSSNHFVNALKTNKIRTDVLYYVVKSNHFAKSFNNNKI